MTCPGAYGKAFRIRKACSPRSTTSEARSSVPSRARQKTQPLAGAAPLIYGMRHGAHRRLAPGSASRVDELSQSLADLEEGNALLRDIDGRAGLGVPTLAGVPVADPEAAESSQLDLEIGRASCRERV